MFLQTLVQLNILILATPALAGWTLMPLAQPGAGRAPCVVWQGRTAEAVAPKAEQTDTAQVRLAIRPQPLVLPRLVTPGATKPADQAPTFFVAPAATLVLSNPFPHATRAP
jgi:hypothetical protein